MGLPMINVGYIHPGTVVAIVAIVADAVVVVVMAATMTRAVTVVPRPIAV